MRHRLPFFILFVLLVLSFYGCSNKAENQQPIFYYCNSNIDYSSERSVIGSELSKEPLDHFAYEKLIQKYLAGPQSQKLISPFPSGTQLISFTVEQQIAQITLNTAFSELTGVDLSVACACLSLTIKDMTGCATVIIYAQDALLDNQPYVVVDTNELQLTDQVHP